MKRWDAFKVLRDQLTDQLVVCHFGPARRDWYDVAQGETHTFYLQGGMGMASCIGLGLALAMPHRRAWVFEGDGALALNLNSMITMSAHQPPNLIQFVMSNRGYEAVGGQPVLSSAGPDFVAIAKGAGIRNTYRFAEPEALESALPEIMAAEQFALVDLVLEQGSKAKSKMPWDPLESKYQFARHVERMENFSLLPN
jgi:sulfopyruvate decarboxylase subunit beta